METSEQRILGVDPGSIHMGFGLIDASQNNLRLIHQGVLEPDRKDDLQFRLHQLHKMLVDNCKEWRPTSIAVEEPFVGVNVRSAMAVARAETLVLLVAASHGIPVSRYSPSQVKQAVTGYGLAEKEQVRYMISAILGVPEPKSLDAADAIGVAVCHAYSVRLNQFIG